MQELIAYCNVGTDRAAIKLTRLLHCERNDMDKAYIVTVNAFGGLLPITGV